MEQYEGLLKSQGPLALADSFRELIIDVIKTSTRIPGFDSCMKEVVVPAGTRDIFAEVKRQRDILDEQDETLKKTDQEKTASVQAGSNSPQSSPQPVQPTLSLSQPAFGFEAAQLMSPLMSRFGLSSKPVDKNNGKVYGASVVALDSSDSCSCTVPMSLSGQTP